MSPGPFDLANDNASEYSHYDYIYEDYGDYSELLELWFVNPNYKSISYLTPKEYIEYII